MVQAILMVFHVESDHCVADGVTCLVDDFAAELGHRCQTQYQAFGVEFCTGDDGSRELSMLFIGRANESTLGALQRKLAAIKRTKCETAVVSRDYESCISGVRGVR